MLSAFAAGLAAGGATTATVLWAIGLVLPPLRFPVIAIGLIALAAVGVGRDFGLIHLHLPENQRLVPQSVLDKGLIRGSLQFGFEMGTGVRTYVSSSAPYVVAATILLASISLTTALLLGAGFGLGRAAMLASRRISRVGSRWDRGLAKVLPLLVPVSTAATAVGSLMLSTGA